MKRGIFQIGMALMLLGAAAALPCARGEEPTLQEKVKAVYVFNFLQFTEWPEAAFENRESPIVVGFVGDSAMSEVFRAGVVGKAVNGRAVLVKQIQVAGDAAGCQVIVIPGEAGAEQLKKLGMAGAVLTIGDAEGFSEAGGVMEFYVEDGKERFEVNTLAAERAHLQISSKLLKLARIVRK